MIRWLPFIFIFCFVPFALSKKEIPPQTPSAPPQDEKKEFLKPLYIFGETARKIEITNDSSLVISNVGSKKETQKQITLNVKKDAQIKIKTPPRDVYVIFSSRINQLKISKVKKTNIFITSKKAEVLIEKSHGNFRVTLDEGSLKVQKSSGTIKAQLYSTPVLISHFKGDVQLRSHLSSLSLSTCTGRFDIKTYAGALSFNEVQGPLKFWSKKSSIELKNVQGEVTGYSAQGNITGSFSPLKTNIETVSGMIRLYFQSSNYIEAQSWKGRVRAPKNFYTDRAGGVSKAHGTIKDRKKSSGQVSLKSHSGSIYIL